VVRLGLLPLSGRPLHVFSDPVLGEVPHGAEEHRGVFVLPLAFETPFELRQCVTRNDTLWDLSEQPAQRWGVQGVSPSQGLERVEQARSPEPVGRQSPGAGEVDDVGVLGRKARELAHELAEREERSSSRRAIGTILSYRARCAQQRRMTLLSPPSLVGEPRLEPDPFGEQELCLRVA